MYEYAYGSCHRTKYRAERIFHWQTPFCASTLKYNYLLPFRVIGHLNALAACKRQKHIFRLTGQARLIHENQPPHARFFDTQFCLTLYTDAVGGLNSCSLMHKNSSVYKRKGAKKKKEKKVGAGGKVTKNKQLELLGTLVSPCTRKKEIRKKKRSCCPKFIVASLFHN